MLFTVKTDGLDGHGLICDCAVSNKTHTVTVRKFTAVTVYRPRHGGQPYSRPEEGLRGGIVADEPESNEGGAKVNSIHFRGTMGYLLLSKPNLRLAFDRAKCSAARSAITVHMTRKDLGG